MKESDFIALDQKINYLVALCQKLTTENRQLRQQEQSWVAEKAKLMEKNDIARTKVEAMIQHLRSLEHES
ncbi:MULTISPECIES: TIGR02449 family protein [Gammaproteobacteria]|uniref:TIGR02449 family protein n=1 Tax=Gammaproteobacteria TaxID=1236 RepID=UPI001ADC00DB|nr:MULTISPECIES: TIGR02449 family protein [Gammaproteobacteria]MBO9480860.1 TIGR02449 family protein [Salinisphaera sp. G21_0]MBO9495214.1 TIGR02449 family protein [Thalassotalea sp. G20_0]